MGRTGRGAAVETLCPEGLRAMVCSAATPMTCDDHAWKLHLTTYAYPYEPRDRSESKSVISKFPLVVD